MCCQVHGTSQQEESSKPGGCSCKGPQSRKDSFTVTLEFYLVVVCTDGLLPGDERPMLVLRQVLVVTPTADGNSVDVDYEVSDARLDAWAQRHGVPPVHTPPLAKACMSANCTASLREGWQTDCMCPGDCMR